MTATVIPHDDADGWLAAFHAGDRRALETCYREHYATVDRAVGRVLSGADRETVVQAVFLRLVQSRKAREGFTGGSLTAWLRTLARHEAIDYWRRHRRERAALPEELDRLAGGEDPALDAELDAQALIERFRRERLPERWRAVFEARFLDGLSQREAAARLGIRRTTLVYQELRVRALLERFVLGEAP